MNWMEWTGYGASLLILISMVMTSIVRLRIFNLAGSLLFVAYGFLIEAYPVALMNALIAVTNTYYLIRIFRMKKDDFSILETNPEGEYIREFIRYHLKDIRKFNPDFDPEGYEKNDCWLLLKKMTVAGIFIGERRSSDTMHIQLDYILKPYRNFSLGKFLYEKNCDWFRSRNISKLSAEPGNKSHNHYLKKMGFRYSNGEFVRSVKPVDKKSKCKNRNVKQT